MVNLSVKGIKTQPKAQTVVVGETAEFSVETTVVGATYQWQYSKDGGKTWLNSSAAAGKTDTYTVVAEARQNGWKYRCKVTYGDTTLTSSAVILIVNAK